MEKETVAFDIVIEMFWAGSVNALAGVWSRNHDTIVKLPRDEQEFVIKAKNYLKKKYERK